MSTDKRWWKIVIKIALYVIGIWMALLIVLQLALSEKVLTKIVNKYAAEYVDGNLSFGSASVSMFKKFPRVFLTLEDFSITYPDDRFDIQEKMGAQGHLMYSGCGNNADTLASFKRFSASLDIASLINGTIKIPHVRLVQPRIFVHLYANGDANWNIFRLEPTSEEDDDTTTTSMPKLSLGRISLTKHPHIVYSDSRDTIFAMIDVASIAFNGHGLNISKLSSSNRVGLTVDSLFVAGRIKADTVALAVQKFYIQEDEEHMNIDAKARAMLATSSFGRIPIPIEIAGKLELPKDTIPAISLSGFTARIADIPFVADADIRFKNDRTAINARAGIKDCQINDVLHGLAKNIVPELEMLDAEGILTIMAQCNGDYINATGKMPMTQADMTIDTEINGLSLKVKGGVRDLLGTDPSIEIDGNLDAVLDSLSTLLPDSLGISAGGSMSASLHGKALMSQLNLYNFSRSSLNGHLSSEGITFLYPSDTIDVNIKGLNIQLGPEEITSRFDTTRRFRLIGVTADITKADIAYGSSLTVKAQDFHICAKNSVDEEPDTTKKIHPFSGKLKVRSLTVKDASSTSLLMQNTDNSFRIFPKKGQPQVPVLTFASNNKRITMASGRNIAVFNDAVLKASAAMNTVERRQKARAFIDSLAKVYPDVPRDSLFVHMQARRATKEIPDWLKEEDFNKQDIDLRLDETMAGYFRDWDIKGSFGIKKGLVVTPYFPLKNSLKGFELNFTNNEVKIDSFKVTSGKSELEAKGSLTGLKRALLGRKGALKLNLDINSGHMDANQLLTAYSKGSMYIPTTADIGEISENELLEEYISTDTLSVIDSTPSLIIVPANLIADIRLNASNVRYTDLIAETITSKILMKERCIQITDTRAETNMGRMNFNAFYATRNKQDIKVGFDLNFNDITSDKVISLMPAIDTIMPLLKSFSGLLDCEVAATASLDTNMNLVMPSINGVMRFGGEDLTIANSDMFKSLAKKLLFKNKKEGKIEKMVVEGVIKDNTLEVFPFILHMDRYMLALSGIQNLDMSYKYHASLIKSPFLIRLGVDVYGEDFDNMKFKIGRAKYKSANVPVFSAVVDQTKINLVRSIQDIFNKGVEAAVAENARQSAILEHKKNIGYVRAVDMKLEELSESEQKQMEDEEAAMEAENTVTATETTNIEQQ